MCAAGYTAELSGGTWLVTRTPDGWLLAGQLSDLGGLLTGFMEYLLAEPADPEHEVQFVCGHRVVHVQKRALRLLGLTPSVCYDEDDNVMTEHPLFSPGNSLTDLYDWQARLYPPASAPQAE